MDYKDIQKQLETLLDLPDNWDGEGSPKCSQDAIDKVIPYIKCIAEYMDGQGIELTTPYLFPGPQASVDVHWKTQEYELLLTVSKEDEAVSYFGDTTFDKRVFKGKLYLDSLL